MRRTYHLLAAVVLGCGQPPRQPPPAPQLARAATADAATPDAPADAALPPPPPPSRFTQPSLAVRKLACGACSYHGRCVTKIDVAFPELAAQCDCDAGFLAHGMECIRCLDAPAEHLDIPVAAARVRGAITLDGKPLPAELAGEVVLVAAHSRSNAVVLGRDHFETWVIAGRYDVAFRGSSRDDEPTWIVLAHDKELRGDVPLDLKLPFQRITGHLAFTGDAPPAALPTSLELRRGDDRIVLATSSGDFTAFAPHGSYDAYIAATAHGPETTTILPKRAWVSARMDFEVPLVRVTGKVVGTDELAHEPRIGLWSPTAAPGEWPPPTTARVGKDGAFSILAVRGRYDVMLGIELGDVVQSVRVAHDLDAGPQLAVTLPPLARVHGRFFIGSQPWGTWVVRSGPLVVALGEDNTYGYIKLHIQRDGTYEGLVPRGRYLLAYAREAELGVSGVLPIERVTIDGDTEWSYNLPQADVTAAITLDRGPLPAPAVVTLASRGGAASYRVGDKPARVPPGSYDLELDTGSERTVVARGLTVPNSGAKLALDVPTRRIAGTVTRATAVPASASVVLATPSGQLHLDGSPFDRTLLPGTYGIYYVAPKPAPSEAQNRQAFLGCVQVR